MPVPYQDAVEEPSDAEAAEPKTCSEAPVRLWPGYTRRPALLLGPAEMDTTPLRGALSGQHRKHASAVALVHHTPHHPSHGVQQRGQHPSLRQPGDLAKRVLDLLGALLLAVLLSPLLLVVAATLARDRGPILYRHSRTGRNGRTFGCLKFRTMVPDAERALRDLLHQNPDLQREWMRDQKLRDDPRVTAIGRFLRRTSLDELPQLWNVLKGDMSLVGPRPVVREEWQRYGRRLGTFLAAKPGVTGLWQVMGRSDCGYRRRVALDTYYVRKRGLLLDISILLRTVKIVLCGRGAY